MKRCLTCGEQLIYCRCAKEVKKSEREYITSEADGREFVSELLKTFKTQGPGAATQKLNALRKSELVIVSNVMLRQYLSTPVHNQKG